MFQIVCTPKRSISYCPVIAQTRKAASNVRAILFSGEWPCKSYITVSGPGPYQVFSISSNLLVSEDMFQIVCTPKRSVIAR